MTRVKILVAFLLLVPVSVRSAPNLADYTTDVHVESSHLINVCGSDIKGSTCFFTQKLNVLIDGKKYEIEDGSPRKDLLRKGDYKARILDDETTRPYEYRRIFELLFEDGKARKYVVVGEAE